jgi:hypothetical protein
MDAVYSDQITHLMVVCEGVWDPVDVTDIARRTRAVADELGRGRVFVDWFAISAPVDDRARVYSGEDIATFLTPLKIAVFSRKAVITRVGESVALSRGARVLVHHDRDHLLKWLLNDD